MWNDVFLLYTESWKSLNVFFKSIPFSPEGSEHLSLWPVLQPTPPLGNRTKPVDCWWVRSTCVGGIHIKSSHVTEWKQYRCYESLASVHRLCECSGRGLFTLLSSLWSQLRSFPSQSLQQHVVNVTWRLFSSGLAKLRDWEHDTVNPEMFSTMPVDHLLRAC